jgi:hypothetical protein
MLYDLSKKTYIYVHNTFTLISLYFFLLWIAIFKCNLKKHFRKKFFNIKKEEEFWFCRKTSTTRICMHKRINKVHKIYYYNYLQIFIIINSYYMNLRFVYIMKAYFLSRFNFSKFKLIAVNPQTKWHGTLPIHAMIQSPVPYTLKNKNINFL